MSIEVTAAAYTTVAGVSYLLKFFLQCMWVNCFLRLGQELNGYIYLRRVSRPPRLL